MNTDYGSLGGMAGSGLGSLYALFQQYRNRAEPGQVPIPTDEELTTPAKPETVQVPTNQDLQGGTMGRLAKMVMGGDQPQQATAAPAAPPAATPASTNAITDAAGPAPNQRSFYQGGIAEQAEVEHGQRQMADSAKLGKGVGKLVKMLASMGAGGAAGMAGGGAGAGAGAAGGAEAGAGAAGAAPAAGTEGAGGMDYSSLLQETGTPNEAGIADVNAQAQGMPVEGGGYQSELQKMLKDQGKQQLQEQLGEQQGDIVEGLTDYGARQNAFEVMLNNGKPTMSKDIFGY